MNVPDCHTHFNFICFHNYIITQSANSGNGILKKKNTCTFSGTGVRPGLHYHFSSKFRNSCHPMQPGLSGFSFSKTIK